ncbi:MAG: hypothetical protein R2797_12055 [Gelidibacter sp.]
MKKLYFKERPLDLHTINHPDVPNLVENYVLCRQNSFPLKIITGDSDKMKSIVTECLKSHNFKYQIGDKYNKGYIAVLS